MPDASTPLRPFDDAGLIHVKRVPLRFYGLPLGARMTVVRLADESLWLHSPTALTAETRAEVEALGAPRFLIAPNRLHHLWIGDWIDAFPDAERWGSPALLEKRRDIAWTGVLGDEPPRGWADAFDQCVFGGYPWLGEAVFNHRPSRTLILCDLLESTHPTDPWYMRLFGRLAGDFERPTLTRDQRLMVRDREAARASVDRILSWDFERIVLSHGKLVERDGKRVFAEGMKWLTG